MMGFVSLQEKTGKDCLCRVKIHKDGHLETRKWVLTKHWLCQYLDLLHLQNSEK